MIFVSDFRKMFRNIPLPFCCRALDRFSFSRLATNPGWYLSVNSGNSFILKMIFVIFDRIDNFENTKRTFLGVDIDFVSTDDWKNRCNGYDEVVKRCPVNLAGHYDTFEETF